MRLRAWTPPGSRQCVTEAGPQLSPCPAFLPLLLKDFFLFHGSVFQKKPTPPACSLPTQLQKTLQPRACAEQNQTKTKNKADLEEKGYVNGRRRSAITCSGPVSCLGNRDEVRFEEQTRHLARNFSPRDEHPCPALFDCSCRNAKFPFSSPGSTKAAPRLL